MAFNLSALTAEQQAAAIYIGYYDRAPDPYGMEFWEAAVANPVVPLVDIATYFAAQEETYEVHPFFVEPSAEAASAFISELYLNLFNREPDASGLTFWSNVLQGSIAGTNEFSVGEIILEIIQGAQNSVAGQDITTLLNKIEVANAWTAGAAEAGLTEPSSYGDSEIAQNSAKSIIEGVTSSSATVTEAKAVIVTAFDGLFPGVTVDLTPSADNIELTRGSDTVTGVIKELSIGDTIIDPSTTDADVLNVEMIEDIASNVTVQNIETVVLNALSGEREIRLTNWDGIGTYQVIGEGDVVLTDVQTTDPSYEFNGTVGTNMTVDINALSTTALADEISVILSNGVTGGTFTTTAGTTVETIRIISNGDDANSLTNVVSPNATTLIVEGDAAFSNGDAFAATIDAIDARYVSEATILTDGALTVLTGSGDDQVTTNDQLQDDTAVVMGSGSDTLILNDSTAVGGAGTPGQAELLGIEFIKTTDGAATEIDMVKSTSTPEFNIAGGSTGIALTNLRDGTSIRTSENATSGDIEIGYRNAASDASLVIDLAMQHDGDGSDLSLTNIANVTLNAVNGINDGLAIPVNGAPMTVTLDDTTLAGGVTSDAVRSLTINNNGSATNATDDVVLGDVANSSKLETLALNATGAAVTLGDMDEAEALTSLSIDALGGEVTVGAIGGTNASTELDTITVTATEDVFLGAVAANNTAGVSAVTLAAADGDITGLALTNDAGSIDLVTLSGAGDINAGFTTVLTGSGTEGYVKEITSTNTGAVTLDVTNAKTSGTGSVITLGGGTNNITLDSAMDDSITGGAKADVLILDGDIGSDTIDLAGGTDTLSFANNTTGIVVNIGSTDAYLNGKDGNTATAAETVSAGTLYDSAGATSGDESTVAGVEIVIGGTGADNIFGSTSGDTLSGGGGNDVVNGGAGNDTLNGDAGADTVSGGAGDDTINGGAGTDELTGGAGADTFTIASVDGDTITDFVSGTDVLNLDVDTTGMFSAFAAGSASLRLISATGTKNTAVKFGNVGGALSSGNIFGTYANKTAFLAALAGTKTSVTKTASKTAAVTIMKFTATLNDVSNTARVGSVVGNSHVIFALGNNGEIWAAQITKSMLSGTTTTVKLNLAGNTTATKHLDLDDIVLVAVADGIAATDIVIV